jgi:peptidoglycan hydrolase CwlO-like protein
MDKETMIKFAPWLVVGIAFFMQYNLFVTPAQLEIKHREIIKEVSEVYTTKEQTNDLKNQLSDMQQKIDRIYEKIVK